MEKTLCQRCFHYSACCAIDLSGTLGNPECENTECENFVDSEKVKIQDKAKWIVSVEYYGDYTHVCYCCSNCGQLEIVKIYNKKQWDEYYKDHYLEYVELTEFCKVCGSVMNGIVVNPD